MNKLLSLFLLLCATALDAGPDYLKYRQAFGIKASNLSGYGAFYGFKPTDKTRLQATGVYYLFDHQFKEERWVITNYTFGFEFQRDIIQEARHRFYLMAGGFYYKDDDNEISATPLHVIRYSYNAGVGVGGEYFFHRVTLGLELGYKFYRDNGSEKEGDGELIPFTEKMSKAGVGLNLGFIF